MSTDASSSQGCVLKMETSPGSGVFTAIDQLTSIDGPSETVNQIDTTHLSSTAKEYIGGLEDGGEVSGTMYYAANNAQHQQLRTAKDAQTLTAFRLELNDAISATVTRIAFSAIVTAFSFSFGVDQPVGASFTLKISGAVTITPAT